MRKALARLSAFEEATTGRLLSLKGIKTIGYMVVAGTLLDVAARKIERMNDETVRTQLREHYASQRAGASLLAAPSGADQVLQDVAEETLLHQEINTEGTENDG